MFVTATKRHAYHYNVGGDATAIESKSRACDVDTPKTEGGNNNWRGFELVMWTQIGLPDMLISELINLFKKAIADNKENILISAAIAELM